MMGTIWFVVICASAVSAFQFSQQFKSDPAQLLLEDLPVIENVDRYSVIDGDIELLRKLREEKIFDEETGEEQ